MGLLIYPPFLFSLEYLQAGRLGRLRLSGSNQGKPKWQIKVLNCVLKFYSLRMFMACDFYRLIREFTQPRRRRQQERHKFAYLTMKNNGFARFARAVFIFAHFADVLVLSKT